MCRCKRRKKKTFKETYYNYTKKSIKEDFDLCHIFHSWPNFFRFIIHIAQIAAIFIATYHFFSLARTLIVLDNKDLFGSIFNDCYTCSLYLLATNVLSWINEKYISEKRTFNAASKYIDKVLKINSVEELDVFVNLVKKDNISDSFFINLLVFAISIFLGKICSTIKLEDTILMIIDVLFILFVLEFAINTVKSLRNRYRRILIKECNKRYYKYLINK